MLAAMMHGNAVAMATVLVVVQLLVSLQETGAVKVSGDTCNVEKDGQCNALIVFQGQKEYLGKDVNVELRADDNKEITKMEKILYGEIADGSISGNPVTVAGTATADNTQGFSDERNLNTQYTGYELRDGQAAANVAEYTEGTTGFAVVRMRADTDALYLDVDGEVDCQQIVTRLAVDSFGGGTKVDVNVHEGRPCTDGNLFTSSTYKYDDDTVGFMALFGDSTDTRNYPLTAVVSGKQWDASGSSSSSDCFAGSSLVDVKDPDTGVVEQRRMEEIQIGDLVRTATPTGGNDADADAGVIFSFSPVVYIPHNREAMALLGNTDHRFLQITTEGSRRKIRVTHDHLLAMTPCDGPTAGKTLQLVRAGDIGQKTRGQCLVMDDNGRQVLESVYSIGKVPDQNMRTLVTANPSGYLVVNGIVSSSFGHFHTAPNLFYQLHRAVFTLSPSFLESDLVHWITMKLARGAADSFLSWVGRM